MLGWTRTIPSARPRRASLPFMFAARELDGWEERQFVACLRREREECGRRMGGGGFTMWNDATLWNVGRNTPLVEKDGGWNVGHCFFGCIFASTAHTHHHTRAELVSICMASWHGTNEKRVGEGGGGEGGGWRSGPKKISWRQQCMHHSAARGIYHGWEYTALLSEGKYNLLMMPTMKVL